MKKTATKSDAKNALRTETTAPTALLRAAKSLCPGFEAWEPETVWIELERQGVTLPDVNRDKLMAATALYLVPSFYWDAMVFEKTALAFNDVVPAMNSLEEASPAYLAYAVDEAAKIRTEHGEGPLDFQHEPKVYAATVLHRAGLVLAPPQLSFCQTLLDEMTKDPELKSQVEKASFSAVDEFKETPLDVQRANLAAIALYISGREVAA